MDNPYQTPDSRIADMGSQRGGLPAERWQRFVNVLVDSIGLWLMGVAVNIVILIAGGMAALTHLGAPLALLIGFVNSFVYYVVFEATLGRTPGKFVTGTKVFNERGGKPTTAQIMGRTLARYIPFEFVTFFSATEPGLHDKLSHTRVVKVR